MFNVSYSATIPAALDLVREWHRRAGPCGRLRPPWKRSDLLVGLPVKRSRHSQQLVPEDDSTEVRDSVEWELLWELSRVGRYVSAQLDRVFAFRHERARRDLERHHPATTPTTFAITGSSGLIGSALTSFLRAGGHRVIRLVRDRAQAAGKDRAFWNPMTGEVDSNLAEANVVVHLAGRGIATTPWTKRGRREIKDSRVRSTETISRALAGMTDGPKTLISASAVGYYGDRGAEELDESSTKGRGFLGEVTEEWEKATTLAAGSGMRVVNIRTGVVLTAAGGALPLMLPAFRAGLAGSLGGGSQWLSWVSLDDVVGAVLHLGTISELEGPVNLVSPGIMQNASFTRVLAGAVRRPAFLPVPALLIKAALGDLGRELLLASQRVSSARLIEDGFEFLDAKLDRMLRIELGLVRAEAMK
ncbi:MAG: TIGR01777 family oxidoreductase [Gemmatimonadales bacterium]